MSIDLLVMAAGMGSRFGGLKQTATVDDDGRMILDYSVYDAKEAGADRVVFVIRKDIEKDFREMCSKRIEKIIDTEYVFQDVSYLPEGYSINPDRSKPWGTGHAVWCARNVIKDKFFIINADDYYGQNSYKEVVRHLKSSDEICLAGYKLENTLSENGTVSRGICTIKDGYLTDVCEATDIPKDNDYPDGTIVSMNMWGLNKEILSYMEKELCLFLDDNLSQLKSEFYLPAAINAIKEKYDKKVRVLPTDDEWYGITYAEDLEGVREKFMRLSQGGFYNWEKYNK